MIRLSKSKSKTIHMNRNLWKSMRFEKSLSSETTIEAMKKSSRWNATTMTSKNTLREIVTSRESQNQNSKLLQFRLNQRMITTTWIEHFAIMMRAEHISAKRRNSNDFRRNRANSASNASVSFARERQNRTWSKMLKNKKFWKQSQSHWRRTSMI